MAVKCPTMYYDMYIGSMTEQQVSMILGLRESKVVPNLKGMLYNFPRELILESIEKEVSIRTLLENNPEKLAEYKAELRDYQTVGTAFMYLSPRSILADGCGLGKTAEVAGLINFLKARGTLSRFLIAVETSAINQTIMELQRFTGLRVVGFPSEAPKIKRMINKTDWSHVDGVVIKHSTLRSDPFSKWLALNIGPDNMSTLFNVFFLDESSVIKNDTTKLYNYTKNICDMVPRVHLMNATAFETCIEDVYIQMDMMNPTLLPKKWKIQNEYCTYGQSSYWTKVDGKAQMNWRRERSGYKNQEKFKNSLKPVYFGRSAKDVGKDLPHIYKVYEVQPSNEMSVALTEGYRYNELLNCPSLIPELKIPTDRKNVPKLDRLCDLVEKEFSDRSVMIYCFHLEAQEAIAEEMRKIGRKPITLNGSCTDEARYEAQTGFNDGKYDVIITNIKKSLNLQNGDVCIFYSMETNPSKAFQIASRIDRHTTDDIKTFIMLLYQGTDEYKFFTTTVKQRAKDSRELTIDAKTTVDFFFDSMIESGQVNG